MLSLLFALFTTTTADASNTDWFGKYAESTYLCDTSYFRFSQGKMTVVSGSSSSSFDMLYIEGTSCLWMYNSAKTNVGKFCFIDAATNFSWIEIGVKLHGQSSDYSRLQRCY